VGPLGACRSQAGRLSARRNSGPLDINIYRKSILMRYLLVLLATLFLLAPAAAVGQTTPAVEPGTRVSITLASQSRSIWSQPQVLQGTVTALNADSISLRLDAEASTVTVATASIAQMAVSRGVPSRLESAVWAGAVLGLQGVSLWPAVRDLNNSDMWRRDVLVGAAVGATIGAIVGALEPREQWRRARKGPAPGEFTLPEPSPSPRIALGGGAALLDEGRVSGASQHIQAIVRLTPRTSLLNLRGELLHARSAQTRQYGAGISAAGDAPFAWGPFQPYGIPLGIGVYHRETGRATGDTTQNTGFGVNTGGGLRTRVGDAQVFAEVRVHTIREGGGYSGSLPLTFGIGF
jgi:hypothetical protein